MPHTKCRGLLGTTSSCATFTALGGIAETRPGGTVREHRAGKAMSNERRTPGSVRFRAAAGGFGTKAITGTALARLAGSQLGHTDSTCSGAPLSA